MKTVIKELCLVASALTVMFTSNHLYTGLAENIIASDVAAEWLPSLMASVTTGVFIYLGSRLLTPVSLNIRRHWSLEPLIYETMGLFIVSGILACVAIVISLFVSSEYVIAGNNDTSYVGSSIGEMLLILVCTVVAAPIIEEILFRGILLGALQRVMNVKAAVIVSSLIFGIMHRTSIITVVTTACIGVLLACIYLRHKNLLNSMIVHGLYNFMASCQTFIPRNGGGESSVIWVPEGMPVWLMIVIGIVPIILMGLLLKKGLKETYEIMDNRKEPPTFWESFLGIERIEEH